jgi:hypothetical protein
MKTRALEMGKAGRKPQALGSGRGQGCRVQSPHRHRAYPRPGRGRHR